MKIAVIGAASPGRWLALRAARAGHPTLLQDPLPFEPSEQEHTAGPLRLTTSIEEAIGDADLAIDTAPDQFERKLEIFSLLDELAPPRTILLTPGRAVSIAQLASGTLRWERCFALDVPESEPQADQPLVASLVYPPVTDPKALSMVLEFLRSLGFVVSSREDDQPLR